MTKYIWKAIESENLNCDYTMLFTKEKADKFFLCLEEVVEYNTGSLAKVHVFGKWRSIPRKQTAYGDTGLRYKFSGNTIPAKPWIPILLEIKKHDEEACQTQFNFVLVNRYHNGLDHMGEHRDDEKELCPHSPIASVSLGQERDFIFKHKHARGPGKTRVDLLPITIKLEHGSLLVMKPPTNSYWYHSLPVRKKARHPRINLTFRYMRA